MGKTDTSAVDYLRFLYRCQPGGLVEMRAIPLDKALRVHRMWSSKPSQIAAFSEQFGGRDSGYSVFHGMVKRAREGGTKADLLGSPVVWCDIDAEINGEKTEDIFESIGKMPADIQPSAVVHSGGGLHCVWALSHSVQNLTQIEDANKVAMELMGADACWDATRVMRTPGTYNNKRAIKKLCHVMYCADHMRYDLDELLNRMLSFGKVLNGAKWCDPKKIPKQEAFTEEGAVHRLDHVFGGGSKSKVILEKMWAERVRDGAPRGYMGVHEATIITVARLHCIKDDYKTADEIVKRTIELQKSAPGVDTSSWDWVAEEKKIRRSLETWGEKWKTLKKVQRKAANGST